MGKYQREKGIVLFYYIRERSFISGPDNMYELIANIKKLVEKLDKSK